MALMGLLTQSVLAQRLTDKLDRGLVAVKVNSGVYCSWRILGEEYYDVKYNLYRDGTLIAENLNASNYTDKGGAATSTYAVSAVVRGKEQTQCAAVSPLTSNYLEIKPDHGTLKSVYVPNDATCADVDGDGEPELLMKFDNQSWANTSYQKAGYNGEYFIIEVYKLNGKRLWWIELGPNMGDFQNNEQNIAAFDWDQDGKAEALIRAADGTVIHAADGKEYVIGDKSKNYLAETSSGQWFVHEGAEYLVYMNGETGVPYQTMEYPLKRLEAGETNLEKAWGDGYGHRSTKHFFGAPYLDGRKPSIFLARGIYTRHKMIAYDVDPATHQLTKRWAWNCNDSSSPYYGQGYHNYTVADVDWDGRDEIVFGSMVIDDNGKGLSTTGLGHGDAHHVSDLDPYTWGQQIYACNEDRPANNYRDGTTSKIRHRFISGNDDGRSMAGNFCNDYPGAMGLSAHDEAISCVTSDYISGLTKSDVTQNMRIYWDSDLQEESFNYTNGKNTAGGIYKYGKGLIATLAGSMTNNDTKGTPCFQGDIFGDWREEVIMRTSSNNIRIFTTTSETPWRNYTLWHDMQYRNAMVTQMCGYNQPPHVSYFLGELEQITQAPPALTMTGRTEVKNGGTIANADELVITCETNDMEVSVADGATPYLYIDNAPSWVQGTNSTSTTNPVIKYEYYTHTLKGGAFTGDMRLVKQGDGTLVLPNVTETYTGPTDVWAGKLQFDGTMAGSRVWLNRHTTLISSGGRFQKGIQADYNATLQPGDNGSVGTITTDSLILNFGSRIVFDIDGQQADQVNATVLKVDMKVWPKGGGPTYSTPVFQFQGNVGEGKHALGKVGAIDGQLTDIVIEGLSDKKAELTYEDGTIYLVVQEYKAADVVWSGAVNGKWDLDATANFLDTDGQSVVFVPGSNVTFNDQAQATSVTIEGKVAPGSIVFNNSEKIFTLTGDSIVGEPTLTKTGTSQVYIRNKNHLGNTVISGGTLSVTSLANNSGNEYGALGNVSKNITIKDGGTLGVTTTTTSDQPILVGEGGGTVNVSNLQTFTQSAAIQGAGRTLTKTGGGTLGSPAAFNVKRLVIQAGTVSASESNSVTSLPDTVEFLGGTLRDPVNIYSYTTNKANFVVPSGRTGSFYADSRCNYTGKLLGAGNFNVYATSVRGYFKGDWSGFEGTLTAGTFSSDNYDDAFYFLNGKGLPKATLRLNSGVTFTNTSPEKSGSEYYNVEIGRVTGTGTLAGTGTYTIGGNNSDINVTFSSSSPIVKTGTGTMTISQAGKINKALTVKQGELHFDVGTTTAVIGSNTLTAEGSASIIGSGLLASLNMRSGTQLTPRSLTLEETFGGLCPSTIKSSASMTFDQGSTLNIIIADAASCSSLEPMFLNMKGTVKVILADGYKPQVGDSFTLWTVTRTFSGTPTYDLPQLPDGLGWDTSALAAQTGVLRIVEATGLTSIPANLTAACEVYSLGGQHLLTLNATKQDLPVQLRKQGFRPGTYVVRFTVGQQSQVEKVVVK